MTNKNTDSRRRLAYAEVQSAHEQTMKNIWLSLRNTQRQNTTLPLNRAR